jgi:hypothetical protein
MLASICSKSGAAPSETLRVSVSVLSGSFLGDVLELSGRAGGWGLRSVLTNCGMYSWYLHSVASSVQRLHGKLPLHLTLRALQDSLKHKLAKAGR